LAGQDCSNIYLESKRTGFYFAVLREGEVGEGDPIYYEDQHQDALSITDIVNLYTVDSENQELLHRATQLPALPDSWKEYFRRRLWDADV